MPRHRLRDAVWASLHTRLVAIPGIWKRDVVALRRFVEAVVYVLRTGIAWEDLPAGFGEAGTAYRRFRRWACKGIWDELFLDGIPTDALETVMLDSTACKAQRFASGARGGGEEALGRSRGGLTTKIHALVDGLGRPLCFLLTPGQAADCRQARSLLEGLSFEHLIGDRGYDTDELRDWLEEHEAEAIIPSKRNRKVPIRTIVRPTKPATRSRTYSAGSRTTAGSSCARTRPHVATPPSPASPLPSSTSNSVSRP